MFSATKAVVAGAVWILIGEGLARRHAARRRARPRVRAERQGRDHRRAGDAPHVGLPARAVRRTRLGRPRAPARAVFALALQLGAGHALRVPPDLGALGARRDHRALHGRRFPRRSSANGSSTRSGSSACRSAFRSRSRRDINQLVLTGEAATPDELEAAIGVRDAPADRGHARRADVVQPARGARGRRARRRRGVDRGRSRALLPGAARRSRRDLEAGGPGRRDRERAQPSSRLHGDAREPLARPGASPATTVARRRGAWVTRCRRARSGTTARAVRSRGPIPPPGSRSVTSRTGSTSTSSASGGGRRASRAVPRTASPRSVRSGRPSMCTRPRRAVTRASPEGRDDGADRDVALWTSIVPARYSCSTAGPGTPPAPLIRAWSACSWRECSWWHERGGAGCVRGRAGRPRSSRAGPRRVLLVETGSGRSRSSASRWPTPWRTSYDDRSRVVGGSP